MNRPSLQPWLAIGSTTLAITALGYSTYVRVEIERATDRATAMQRRIETPAAPSEETLSSRREREIVDNEKSAAPGIGMVASVPLRFMVESIAAPQGEPRTEATRVEVASNGLASNKTSLAYEEEENLCPKYWGGPCTRDAHFLLPCSDPRISEWRLTPPGVRYLWCREGSREVRLDGIAAPNAETGALRFASSVVAAKISFAATSEWGWHRAAPGDRYCPRTPKRGWCDESQPAVEGAYYLAYAGRLTHVTLLPCGDERVLEAIAQHWPNVTCIDGDRVASFNVDATKAEPLRIYSDHDRIAQGRVTTEGTR